jgi:hypothetical protein
MTPTDYRAGGANTGIRFAIGECSLDSILVARSERGVCTILMGDDPGTCPRPKTVFRAPAGPVATRGSRSCSPRLSVLWKRRHSTSTCRSTRAAPPSSRESGKRCGRFPRVPRRAARTFRNGSERRSRFALWQTPRRDRHRWQSSSTVSCETTAHSPASLGRRAQARVPRTGDSRVTLQTDLEARFYCSREKDHGVAARIPLRFRHGEPDNAVHKGQRWLKTGAILVTCWSVT